MSRLTIAGGLTLAKGYALQIHPVFMLPPVTAAAFGGILPEDVSGSILVVHLLAVATALYTAHLKDGYVDYYIRGEDESHPLPRRWCVIGLGASSCVFFACLAGIWWSAGFGGVLFTLPGWLIGYFHAPQLDMHPLGATSGYPFGISLAFSGGYYLQTGMITEMVLAVAVVLFLMLSGVKVIDDLQDYRYDYSIRKRTIPVVLGAATARDAAYGLLVVGILLVIVLSVLGVFPRSAVVAAIAFGCIASVASRKPPELATMLLIRGSYVFFAILITAFWFQPFK